MMIVIVMVVVVMVMVMVMMYDDGDDTYLCLFSLRGALLKVSGYHLLKLKINNTISLGGLHLGGILMFANYASLNQQSDPSYGAV